MIKQSTVVLISLLISSCTLFAQPRFLLMQKELQDTLKEFLQQQSIPGATVAVVLPDGQLISIAAGHADKEVNTAMPVGSRMLLGSVGKVFVSAVFLQLVDEGKISLDDKVSTYFKNTNWYHRLPNAEEMTVHSLLNHTSGLPRYVFDKAFVHQVKADPMRPWTPTECLRILLDRPAKHPVGRGWGYSDTNYLLLGLIIESITGQSYYEVLQQRVLDPFYLRNTFPSNQRNLPGLTQGYVGNDFFELGKEKTVNEEGLYFINPQFEWTGGGLMTNVEDMAYLLKWLHSGKILTPSTYQMLIAAVNFQRGQPAEQGYGLGTFVWKSELGTSYGHGGVMPGYFTQIEFFHDHGFAVAFQMNTDKGSVKVSHQHVLTLATIVERFLEDQ